MAIWRRIVSEAHRRSMWQVLGIYLMASWLGFEVVLGLVEGVGLPSWLPGIALALFVMGLPVVLATAFVQEGLPGKGISNQASLDPTLFPSSPDPSSTPISRTASSPVSSHDPKQQRPRLRSLLTWRRALVGGVTAFAVLGAATASWLALRALGVGPMASLVAATELQANDRVLIAEFEARGADSTLASVVTDAFRIDFARSTMMRSVTPAEVRDVLRRMEMTSVPRLDAELVHQIAVRDGISAYVTGEVAMAGSAYVLSVRMISTASGEVLAALRERARSEDDLIDAVDRLSISLRERTGESLRMIRRAEPLAKVTTSSLDALQHYTQALRASGQDGDPERSYELLSEAVRLDTAFASAHRALGINWTNRGHVERAIESHERALRFSDRLTEAERVKTRASLHFARAEFVDAATALERVIALDPDDAGALNNLAFAYTELRDFGRAEDYYNQAIRKDTARFFSYTNLGEMLVQAARFDEAEAAFRAATERAPQSAWPVTSLALVPYMAGNHSEAESRLRALLQDPAVPMAVKGRAGELLYLLLRVLGRYEAADGIARTQLAAMGGDAMVESYIAADVIAADVFVFDRYDRVQRHVDALTAATSRTDDNNVLLLAATACAWAGDTECARYHLDRAGDSTLRPWSSPGLRAALAGIARSERDLPRAALILRETRAANCSRCEAPLLGRVFLEMNQPDSTAAVYEAYVATPAMYRMEGDLAPMHEWLARYYEDAGDASTASAHYVQFIELWKDSDAQLQPRVAAARRRLEALQPDR